MKPEQVDHVFSALAHRERRRMLDLLMEAPGMSVKALSSHFAMSRIGVMKHLSVLEAAGLVLSRKEGRVRHLFFNVVPIQAIHDRWSSDYGRFWSERLMDIKERVESRSKEKSRRA